jgi:transcriptional regulator with GAF, ATPase, and Fis domain
VGQLFANVLRHQQNDELLKKAHIKLENAYIKIEELNKRLVEHNKHLDDEIQVTSGYDAPLKCIDAESGYGDMLGHSDAMKAVMDQIEKVACTDSTVLVFGETGTGKELAARTIHQLSARRDKPMVRVNCAAIPESLIESELFGHEKGAFTGADSTRLGRFEIADGSTIFLDEIGELPLAMQTKLLHVLELQQLERVGGSETIDIDVRVVAATNKDLAAEVKEGNFREDLFYRLNVFPIELPPLRQRKEDIPAIAYAFVQEFSGKMRKVIDEIAPKTMEQLKNYPWPGNVRELRNVIERSMILTEGQDLNIKIPRSLGSVHSQSFGLEDVERDHITEVLAMKGWKVRGENGAAELLQLKPSTLESKMQKLGIKRPG